MSGQASEIQWYIAREGKQHGPLTDVELRTFVAHNYMRAGDLIWRPGMAEWLPAPSVFPAAFQGQGHPSAQAAQNAQAAAAAAARAIQQPKGAAAPKSDVEADSEPTRERSSVKRLALASVAITVIGGGAFALVYHKPLIDMVSGASGSADTKTPVVSAPTDIKTAQPAPPSSSASTSERSALGAGDIVPPAAPPAAPPQQTTASVGSGDADTNKQTQVAAVEPTPSSPPPPPSIDGSVIDTRLQKVAVWTLIKREYPDWYASEVTAANKLVADKRSDNEVATLLAQGLVNLRRQNSEKALSASSEKLQNIAVAFLEHLKSLKAQSVSACFGFISKGETSPAVVQMMENPETATALNAQADAVFEAISEGGKNPVKHDSAVKSDYDILIKELGKLGWKEEDLQVFSNPKLLAKREPEQVCRMVQEWFVAHLAVQDKAVRDRLLFETLKPVVSG